VHTIVDRRNRTLAPGRAVPGRDRTVTLAGALLTATGIGVVLSIITNEALYPAEQHYSTFANTISDLSGTEPPDSYTVRPNRLIFILTMAVAGVLVLAATALLRHVARRRLVIALVVFGTGLLGIAVFPGDVATWHPIFALACFVGGAVAVQRSGGVDVHPRRVGHAAARGDQARGLGHAPQGEPVGDADPTVEGTASPEEIRCCRSGGVCGRGWVRTSDPPLVRRVLFR
jgi:hypothetical membrane protein